MDTRSIIQSAIAEDISYLTFMRGQLGINLELVEQRLSDLRVISDANHIPDSYYSIKNGERYGAPTKQHVYLNLIHRVTSVVKTARTSLPKSSSSFTLFNAANQQVLSFTTEHKGKSNYHDDMCGANGKVKKAKDAKSPDRSYALKKFNIESTNDKTKILIKAARSEFFSKLMHWETASAFEYQGKRSDKVCLIMDWKDGEDLFVLYREDKTEKIPFESRLKGLLDIASQIAALHEANLLYQDLKPENVMWTGTRAVLIDTESIIHETERGHHPGICTPKYAGPKLIDDVLRERGDIILTKFINKDTDLHMLGCTLAVFLPELFSLEEIRHKGIRIVDIIDKSAAKAEHGKLMQLIRRLLTPHNCGGYSDAMQFYKELHALITTEYKVDYSDQPCKLALPEENIIERLSEINSLTAAPVAQPILIEAKISHEQHVTDELFLTGRSLATTQLKELMRNVIEKNRHYNKNDQAKYEAIHRLYDRLSHVETLDDANILRLTKVFLRLAMQNVGASVTGRTTSGKEIIKLLNSDSRYQSLVSILFPELPANTKINYDHLRSLVGGANDHSIFRKKQAATLFANFNQDYSFASITLEKLNAIAPGA